MSTNDPKNSLAPRSKKFFADISKECLPRIDRATVSTVGIQDDKVRHDRTGVLYRINEEHFILTAAHDLHEIVHHKIPLYVSVNRPDVSPLPLAEAQFHSTEEDARDIAIIWLPPDLAAEVGKFKDFIHHNQINFSTDDSTGPLIFYGYPMDWAADFTSETSLQSTALAFAGLPYKGDRHPIANYNSDVNIVLQFDRDDVRTIDGASDKLPKPKGISGCGIWQVGDFDYSAKEIRPRSANTLTLVGIQHRWFPDYGYVQGTRIRYALALVLLNFPHLDQAMNIVYPTGKAV